MREGRIGPFWNKPLDLSQRMMDPLGLSRVSEWIVDELIPGVTTLTTRARNYSFYCWMLSDIIKRNKGKGSVNFEKEIRTRESAFVLSSIFHECNREASPIGVRKATNVAENTQRDEINLDFKVLNNNKGGFGQYYRSAMETLGLIFRTSRMSIPTPKGKELSESFENWIKDTEYYKKYIGKIKIPKQILSKYGSKACVCQLTENEKERNILTDVFLSNSQKDDLEFSRRNTILMILKLVDFCSSNNIEFNDGVFRNFIFFQQIKNEKDIIDIQLDELSDNSLRWRFFQFHEYLTYALEMILHCFLLKIRDSEEGLAKNEFIEEISGFKNQIQESLGVEVNTNSIKEILTLLLDKVGKKDITPNNCRKFDKRFDLKSNLNEENLREKADYFLKKGDISGTIGIILSLLIVNLLRFCQYKDRIDEIYLWYYNRAIQEISHSTLIEEQEILEKENIDTFFECLFDIIIETHDEIAFDKVLSGSDTFRFSRLGDKFKFKNMYKTVERNTRMYSVRNILEDLGAIEKSGEIYNLTKYGKNLVD